MAGLTKTGGNPDTFLSSLLEFCVVSASTCFSKDADKLCVPIGLSSLSALLIVLSCCLLVYQRCRFQRETPGDTITFFYGFLGSLCSTVGAILSRQLHIQILLAAVAATVDAVHFISCSLSVLLCWNSKAERRLRMMRRRRRQHLLAVCVLMAVAGGFLKSRVTQHRADRPLSGRTLLNINLADNTELLGYILGLLSFVIACTSRFPVLHSANRGQMMTWASMFSGLLCSLAGALYTAAILLYDTHFEFLLRVMPWLLSAICSVSLDLLILVIHWCKRGTRQHLTSLPPDTESLLGDSGFPAAGKVVIKRLRKQPVHSSAQTKTSSVHRMTEMGRYMDVSVQPARKICLNEMMSKEEVAEQLLNETVGVIRGDSVYSSNSSYDSSLISSDLEWDFEETKAPWSEPTAKQQCQPNGWSTSKSFNICTCAMSGLSPKTLSGREEAESVSSISLAK